VNSRQPPGEFRHLRWSRSPRTQIRHSSRFAWIVENSRGSDFRFRFWKAVLLIFTRHRRITVLHRSLSSVELLQWGGFAAKLFPLGEAQKLSAFELRLEVANLTMRGCRLNCIRKAQTFPEFCVCSRYGASSSLAHAKKASLPFRLFTLFGSQLIRECRTKVNRRSETVRAPLGRLGGQIRRRSSS
jgi:hypothetical protein